MLATRRDMLALIGLAASATIARAQGSAVPPTTLGPVPVVASFSILADFVRQVGRDRLAITTLVGPGADAHVYVPTPADARALAASRLVVINGLGFESWISRLVRSSGTKATVLTAARDIVPLRTEEGGHNHGHGHAHGEVDPHAWQSVENARRYVATIAAGLSEVDPAGQAIYAENAAAYSAQLEALDAELKVAIARIPRERRKVITSHDAFQYFEKAYGIDFISPRGASTSAEPSPQAIGRIIRQIRTEKIPAVFLENISDQRLMKRIADETGARIGGTLYSDALTTADGPAPTYIAMMRHNMREIVGALATS